MNEQFVTNVTVLLKTHGERIKALSDTNVQFGLLMEYICMEVQRNFDVINDHLAKLDPTAPRAEISLGEFNDWAPKRLAEIQSEALEYMTAQEQK